MDFLYNIIKKILVRVKIVPVLYKPYKVQLADHFVEYHFRQYQPPFIQVVPPKQVNHGSLPEGLKTALTAKAVSSTQQPSAGVWVLSNASVYGNIGYVLSDRKKILQESVREYRVFNEYKAESLIFKAKKKYLGGTGAVITTAGAENYFHWVFDCLPRLHLLIEAGLIDSIDYLVVPPLRSSFQREFLNLFDLKGVSLIEVDDPLLLRFDKVFFPTIPAKLGNTTDWSSDFLFALAERLEQNISSKYSDSIYLTRHAQRKRTLLNESEIIDYLKQKKFDIIDCNSLSIVEQLILFRKANIVIAPHGAALTNITFCRPGTKILELMDFNYRVPCFFTIAKHRHLIYDMVTSDEKEKITWQNYYEEEPNKYTISIQLIKNTLDSWMV